MPTKDNDNIVILYKGGRLPSWYQLSEQQQSAYSQSHVDLMLSVAGQHRMQRLEGFRLIGPQDTWQRFWLIEFPSMEGAQAWIEAEMAPPYGQYGYYEYFFSKSFRPDVFSDWVTNPAPPTVPLDADPHTIPELWTDTTNVVVLMLARYRPGAEELTPEERGDAKHVELMRNIAKEQGLIRLEAFRLLAPQDDWHRAWIIELPSFEAAEAWIEGEESLPHGMYARRDIYLTRKWSPEYFASWVPRNADESAMDGLQ